MNAIRSWLQQPLFAEAPPGFGRKAMWGVFFLILLGLKVTWGLSQSMDLLLWDEANYMKAGSHFLKHINKEWGPAYAAWYQGGYIFFRDFLNLYMANQVVLAIIVPVLFYLLLLRSGINSIVSLLVGAGWLCASFHLPMWPKVSHFCLVMVLGGLLVASRYKQTFMQWAWVAFGAMLAAFARPELYLSFLPLFAIAIGSYALSRPDLSRRSRWSLAVMSLVAVFLHVKIGIPILNGSRSGMAFAQHFAYNVVLQKNLQADFWIIWPEICKEYFGGATSFSEAWKSNREAVTMHMGSNVKAYLQLLLHHPAEAVFPSLVWRTPGWLQQLLLLGVLVYGYFIVRRRAVTALPSTSWKVLLVLLLLAAPALLACIFIFPREHYFLLQLPLLLFIIALPFTAFSFSGQKFARVLPAMLVLTLLLAPTAKKYTYFHLWQQTDGTPNSDAYRLLKKLKGAPRLEIMDNEGGMAKFIKGAKWIRGFDKEVEKGFYDFRARREPDIIYVTPALMRDPRYVLDGQWMVFLQSPTSFGYAKVALSPSTNFYLLVRNKPPYNSIIP